MDECKPLVSPYCLGALAIAAGEKTSADVAAELATKTAVGTTPQHTPYISPEHPLNTVYTPP
jgi:hypothetical protein